MRRRNLVWDTRNAANVRPARKAKGAGRGSSPALRLWKAGLSAASGRIARGGRRGYGLAARLDLVGAMGAGYVWRRLRAQRRLPEFGEAERNAMYERIWREAAEIINADFCELAPGLFECSRDGAVARVYQQLVALDDPVTLRVALDKPLVHLLLTQAEVRIPEYLEFDATEPAPALEFLAQADGPCVVKPAAGTGGGSGTTTDVATADELMRARLHVGAGRSLIERQVEGAVYRLLLLDDDLLDVVRSVPGHLVGNGRATVEQLIARENDRRVKARGAAKLWLLGVNLDMVIALEREGLTLSSVPAAGQRVRLGTVTNNNAVEDNETYREEIAPEVLSQARAAQRAVGLRLAGVDVITSDPALPLAETGGVINEVNGMPGLHHHYLVADPQHATRVAVPVLERVLAEALRAGGPASDPRPLGADVAARFTA
jgi:glutathione synthase/RimK-type ligase-like ATP-grasp enzyme